MAATTTSVGRFLAIEVPEERRLAEVRERPADVGLEQHDGGKRHVEEHVPDEPVERLQRRQLRDIEQKDDKQRSGRHLDRPRTPNQLEELVYQQRYGRNVEQIPPADGGPPQHVGQVVQHGR